MFHWSTKMLQWSLALYAGAVAVPVAGAQASYSYYEVGKIDGPAPARTKAALLLVGGGDWDKEAFHWFGENAGHGHIVIISASGGADSGNDLYREIGGIESVQTIEFHDRSAAFDPNILSILRHADGIFIAGGDQSKYVRFWKSTPVAHLIDEHVRSGKPLGGTSAGLAILGGVGYGAMDGGSIDSKAALADPGGPAVTLVGDFLHLPLLSHIVTDTHFTARDRLGRLIAFVAQVRSTTDPDAVGLGIDEGSALAVDASGDGRLYTNRKGFAWLIEPKGIAKIVPGKPLNYAGVRITGIGPQGAINLRTLRVTNAAFSGVASVVEGQLEDSPRPELPKPSQPSSD